MIIKNLKDVYLLKNTRDLDEVIIYTRKLKYKGVLHYALKYAYWSLKDLGSLKIIDNGPFNIQIRPYSINFHQVIQLTHQFLKDGIELVDRNFEKGYANYIIKKEINEIENVGWSAGIIFSGNAEEIPLLKKCLNGIFEQPEFNSLNSEVVLCGPMNCDYTFISQYPFNLRIIYIDDIKKNGRFLISKKKNFLIENLKYENNIVLHSRIQLKPNSVSNIPKHFEFISPEVNTIADGQEVRYLDYLIGASYNPTRITTGRIILPNFYKPKNYLKQLKYGLPFIDGGVMIFKNNILKDIPLNANLAWFENEDVDLAARLHLHGYLVDFAPEVKALSNSDKLNRKRKFYRKFPFVKSMIKFKLFFRILINKIKYKIHINVI